MGAGKEKGCWVQCQNCGHIYHIERYVPIDKLYITCECPKCDSSQGLNLGDNEDNIYLYYDANMDFRFYQY